MPTKKKGLPPKPRGFSKPETEPQTLKNSFGIPLIVSLGAPQ